MSTSASTAEFFRFCPYNFLKKDALHIQSIFQLFSLIYLFFLTTHKSQNETSIFWDRLFYYCTLWSTSIVLLASTKWSDSWTIFDFCFSTCTARY